jgi:hypothetical protein
MCYSLEVQIERETGSIMPRYSYTELRDAEQFPVNRNRGNTKAHIVNFSSTCYRLLEFYYA